MSSVPPSVGRSAVRGYVVGAFVMTFFGALWALLTAPALGAAQRAILFAAVAAFTAFLTVRAVRLLRRVERLPANTSGEDRARGRAAGRRYLVVVGAEFVAIAVVANLLGAAGLAPFVPPVIALVVGLHFLPLAAIFGVRLYYLTGVLIAVPAAIAVCALLLGGRWATLSPGRRWWVWSPRRSCGQRHPFSCEPSAGG